MIMMNAKTVLGIVAEYDPFHLGHARHLAESRKAVRPDAVYAVLSPCLKQRGVLSLLSPYDRAACALHEGVDAAFALPVLWTIRSAEDYAFGSVSLLCGLGITHLAFGAETPDLRLLGETAALLDNPPAAMSEAFRDLLSKGAGYPAALSRAAAESMPEAETVLSSPNNILAVHYLRAVRKINPGVHPVVIPRRGSYHSETIDPDAPSASALRASLFRGVYAPVFSAMPAFSAALLRHRFLECRVPSADTWNMLVLNRLRLAAPPLPDDTEGLSAGLRKAASACADMREVLARVTGRRYPASRISRLCAAYALGVS